MKEENRAKSVEILIDEIKKSLCFICVHLDFMDYEMDELQRIYKNLDGLKNIALEIGE